MGHRCACDLRWTGQQARHPGSRCSPWPRAPLTRSPVCLCLMLNAMAAATGAHGPTKRCQCNCAKRLSDQVWLFGGAITWTRTRNWVLIRLRPKLHAWQPCNWRVPAEESQVAKCKWPKASFALESPLVSHLFHSCLFRVSYGQPMAACTRARWTPSSASRTGRVIAQVASGGFLCMAWAVGDVQLAGQRS
jgi:hypothetical protein